MENIRNAKILNNLKSIEWSSSQTFLLLLVHIQGGVTKSSVHFYFSLSGRSCSDGMHSIDLSSSSLALSFVIFAVLLGKFFILVIVFFHNSHLVWLNNVSLFSEIFHFFPLFQVNLLLTAEAFL